MNIDKKNPVTCMACGRATFQDLSYNTARMCNADGTLHLKTCKRLQDNLREAHKPAEQFVFQGSLFDA